MLYVSDVDDPGFLRILTLMMFLARSSSSSTLMSVMGRGSMHYCKFMLIKLPCWVIFMFGCLGFEELSVLSSHVVTLQSSLRIS